MIVCHPHMNDSCHNTPFARFEHSPQTCDRAMIASCILQAIVGAAEDAQTSGKSRASKNSSAATATKPAGKKAKASSGKENVKPAAAKKAKGTPDKKPRKKSDKPRNKSGYNMFCAAQRPILKGGYTLLRFRMQLSRRSLPHWQTTSSRR